MGISQNYSFGFIKVYQTSIKDDHSKKKTFNKSSAIVKWHYVDSTVNCGK